MEEKALEEQIRLISSQQFSRSGGPGGQNVNKVNSRVTLRIPLNRLELTEEQQAQLQETLGKRINSDGELIIHSNESRSQQLNREHALERACRLITTALKPRRRRRPSGPTKGSRERRLKQKHQHALRKEMRRPPDEE
jgi:ribosome-associated protein